MTQTFFRIRRPGDAKERDEAIKNMLDIYKGKHKLHSQFEALEEIIKKEVAALKLPK